MVNNYLAGIVIHKRVVMFWLRMVCDASFHWSNDGPFEPNLCTLMLPLVAICQWTHHWLKDLQSSWRHNQLIHFLFFIFFFVYYVCQTIYALIILTCGNIFSNIFWLRLQNSKAWNFMVIHLWLTGKYWRRIYIKPNKLIYILLWWDGIHYISDWEMCTSLLLPFCQKARN